ncbi:Protein SGT1 like protein ecdysoneless [Dufourea novaeangliae]|uniref:Protein SGT1 like protein ecdysoneless n=2 Tax=Dufourea novaeangliae TaxID=178035 RepID=A0A154PJA6_DUFNO|nr:Protein SGT1 like protein ecdysoneless [Dufourea novaeangliae]
MAHTKITKIKEDDFLECFLYPKVCYTQPSETITEEILLQEISKFNEEIASFVEGYIWHSDRLILRPRTKQVLLLKKLMENLSTVEESDILPHIYISLHFDEDISDEWFLVFLIFKLTQTFDGLIAKLIDSDGEFLLIETANVLPSWVNPETCENCVFVYNGELHVVREKYETLFDLLNNIHQKSYLSKASEKVQNTVKKRIGCYPNEIKKRHHKARVFLPEKAVSILQQEPRLVASAIRTICHSDPLERKVCRAMRYFPPEQRIMVNVKMTKCLYAMAMHCRYTGDPRTGWNIPPTTCSKYNAHILGVKIACGLEMLVARAHEERRHILNASEKSNVSEYALNAYLARLEASGYFKNLLKGSQEYQKLLNIATDYYLQHFHSFNCATNTIKSDAEEVLEAWDSIQSNDVELHAQDEAALSPPDNDSWLNIDPVLLETLLSEQWGNVKNKKQRQELLSLREKVQSFLNHTSDIDGVQLLEEHSMEADIMHDSEDNGKIEFDADIFDCTLQGILDLVVPGSEGEFEGSSEGSLGEDDEDKGGEMDKYMRLLNSELQSEMMKDERFESNTNADRIEENLMKSIEEEAGGAGPAGNIIGGPVRRFMHLQLQSPTTVPPDLES